MNTYKVKTTRSVETWEAVDFESAGKIADEIGDAVSITLTKTPSGRPRSLDNFVLKQAAELVVRNQYATVNYLCRHLGIGNARANRIMDRMEELGIVGPFHGSKPREVLVKSIDKALAGILK